MLVAALAGFALGLSLIVAIGAQNAFVLRQGLLGRHVGTVVSVCIASDVVLIALGVAGAGAVLATSPGLEDGVRVVGAVFLLAYATMAARRALRPSALHAADAQATGIGATVATVLALTWLNPHVYLDTVLLVGTLAHARGDGRWWFGLGAAVASALWFSALGYGAALLRPLFAAPAAWRVLDGLIAVVMTLIAIGLLRGL